MLGNGHVRFGRRAAETDQSKDRHRAAARPHTPAVVREWRANLLAGGASESSAAKAYRLLRAILNSAVDDDIIERNPCRIRAGGAEHAAERPTLTAEQVLELCSHVTPRFEAFIAVKAFGSLRWGEITALHRSDLDLDDGLIHVRAAYVERSDGSLQLGPPKSRASVRSVALPSPVVAMLQAHLEAFVAADPAALVFTGPSGRPLRRSNFNKSVRWAEVVAALGVPHLHLHDLRHTGNTLAAGTPGVSICDLMERMGHDSMRAALIYQHATRHADTRIAQSLQQHIESATGDSAIARGSHGRKQATHRRSTVTTRGPRNRGPRVASGGSAGVVQWQNISFPS